MTMTLLAIIMNYRTNGRQSTCMLGHRAHSSIKKRIIYDIKLERRQKESLKMKIWQFVKLEGDGIDEEPPKFNT